MNQDRSTFNEKLKQLRRLHDLISIKATGSPILLSKKLNVSLRTVHRLVFELRRMNAPVHYDQDRETYYYYDHPISFEQLVADSTE